MPRKLKVYQTSLGFFDLAIAAPSMKAALESWGAGSNLFHQRLAKETDDPDVVAATMAKPGVVLKRAGWLAEQSGIPSQSAADLAGPEPRKKLKSNKRPPAQISKKAARQEAIDYDKEQQQRQAQRRREEAARAKVREHQERAIAKAQAALDVAEREHEA